MADHMVGQASEQVDGRRFTGKVALVTGAAAGIGYAVASQLAREGASVMLADVDEHNLRRALEELGDAPGEVAGEVADIADANQRERLVPAVLERWGRVDVLVNNAAYHGPRAAFLDLPSQEWERVLTTNVTAAAGLCRAAAADMLHRGEGAIVNIAAIQVDLPVSTYSAYVSSKGAVLALTRALAVELSPAGVRVNAVAPGIIATGSFRDVLAGGHGSGAAQAEQGEPAEPAEPAGRTAALLGRHGRPSEVARAVAFLASTDASFVTGTTLHVDGGRSLSRLPDPIEAEVRGYPIQGSNQGAR